MKIIAIGHQVYQLYNSKVPFFSVFQKVDTRVEVFYLFFRISD